MTRRLTGAVAAALLAILILGVAPAAAFDRSDPHLRRHYTGRERRRRATLGGGACKRADSAGRGRAN